MEQQPGQVMKHCNQAAGEIRWRMSYGVAVILGESFSSDLKALAKKMHVWVPRVDTYADTIAELATQPSDYSSERGITTYIHDPEESPEETLMSLLVTIDMHHGEFSHDPPWQFMEVHGATVTDSIKEAFAPYEATTFQPTADGFLVTR